MLFESSDGTNKATITNFEQYMKLQHRTEIQSVKVAEGLTVELSGDMSGLFSYCNLLTNISAVSDWDTSSVTNMTDMFVCCGLTDVSDLEKWNTGAVTNMYYMFGNCTEITNIQGLANWNTSAVTDMNSMFYNCTSLTNVNALAKWDTHAVTNMSYMFDNCIKLSDISGLSNWDTSSVTNMNVMFFRCESLTTIDALANWDTSAVRTVSGGMFAYCTALHDISVLSNWDLSSLTEMNLDVIFAYCSRLKTIGIPRNRNTFFDDFTGSYVLPETHGSQYRYKTQDGRYLTTEQAKAQYDKLAGTVLTIEICPYNTTIAGVGDAKVSIDGKQLKDGDTLTLETGKTYTIKWYPQASGNNIKFLNTVGVDGTSEVSAYDNIDKSNWTELNSLYNEKMKEVGNKMVTSSKVVDNVQTVDFVATDKNELTFNWIETAPVYRMYNMITSEHLFTTNKTEYDNFVKSAQNGTDYWLGEGIDWFSTTDAADKTTYRLYNASLGEMGSSSHYYTSDEAEVNDLTKNWGWVADTEDNYFKNGGNIAIYTAYSEALGSAHHYTSSFTEWRGLDSGWDKEDAKNGLASDKKSATGFFNAWLSGKQS